MLHFYLLFCLVAVIFSQRAPDLQFYVVTRDNAFLNTVVWFPPINFKGPWPTMYEQTPYNAVSFGALADYFNALGYAYMCQDVRGQHGSNGSYSFFRTSGNDSMDTIIYWSSHQGNWANGLLAVDGVSADCLAQYADVVGVTQSGYWPNDPAGYQPYMDAFYTILTGALALGNGLGHQTVYQGGAYRYGLVTNWVDGLHQNDYVSVILDNENWGDYWYTLDGQWENQWNIFNTSLLSFAGWYDIFGQLQIETILSVNETANPGAASQQLLMVDPGGHCPIGQIAWTYDLFGWEYFLAEAIPTILNTVFTAKMNNQVYNVHDHFDWNTFFYVLGPGLNKTGNFWVKSLGFPKFTITKYYFKDNGKLDTTQQSTNNFASYTYNPNDPLITAGGNNLEITPTNGCGPWDQNNVEANRTDVLHFTTDTFQTTWAMFGPVYVNLYVQSSAVDTDFIAKIVDYYPDGKQMLIQDSIIRMRWRNGAYATTQAANMEPGQVYIAQIKIGYVNWIFNPGHALRITISSSNYPRFSINYNSGLWVKYGNTSMTIAKNTVWWGPTSPSNVEIPVTDLQWLEDHRFRVEDWKNPNPHIDEKKVREFRDFYIKKNIQRAKLY